MPSENGWNKWQELVLSEMRDHGKTLKHHTKALNELKVNQAVHAERIHTQAKGTARIWGTITSAITSVIIYLISTIFK